MTLRKKPVITRPKRELPSIDDLMNEIASLRDEISDFTGQLYLINQKCAELESRIEELEPDS